MVCPTCRTLGVQKKRLKARYSRAYDRREAPIGYWRFLARHCNRCQVPYAYKHFSTLRNGATWAAKSAKYATLFEYDQASEDHPHKVDNRVWGSGVTGKLVLSSEHSRKASGKKIVSYA